MQIQINTPNGEPRNTEISKALEEHWKIPINHAQTILDQINSGMYEKWFNGKKDLVCIDFGANVGLVSLYMLPYCKKILSVEPTPSHYELLSELLSGNGGDNKSILSSSALAEKDEDVLFAIGNATENKMTSAEGHGATKITVQGKPLSWFVDEVGEVVDFCKVDVEGGEMLALIIPELKKVYGKVKTFFVEVHPIYNGSMDSNREELISRFKEAGFETETIDYQTFIAYES